MRAARYSWNVPKIADYAQHSIAKKSVLTANVTGVPRKSGHFVMVLLFYSRAMIMKLFFETLCIRGIRLGNLVRQIAKDSQKLFGT